MKSVTSSTLAAMLLTLSGVAAQASILYSQNFDSGSGSGLPAGWTASGASASAWGISNAASSSAPNSFRGIDSSSTAYYLASYKFTSLSEIGSQTVGLNFDLRVDDYSVSAPGNAGTFRVAYRPSNSNNAQYAIGLGFANIDGSNHLFFYAGNGSAPVVNSSTAIGYTAGSGFADGFDLGSSTSGGTGGDFYNFAFTFDSVSKAIVIKVTNLADPTQTFTFNDTWLAGIVADTTGELIVSTGTGSTGTMYVDNVSIAAIPEGQHLALVGGAVVAAFAIMRRRTLRA